MAELFGLVVPYAQMRSDEFDVEGREKVMEVVEVFEKD